MLLPKDAVQTGTISEGDDVFFCGLFTPHAGLSRNIPIFRFGSVSMLSQEPIHWFDKMTDLYLIEAMAFGGNSGSPVFLNHGLTRKLNALSANNRTYLAGVLIGNFGDFDKVRWVEASRDGYSRDNTGISAVVPAYRIRELLDLPDLKKERGEINPPVAAGPTNVAAPKSP